MMLRFRLWVYLLNFFVFVKSAYPPQGEEVQMGTVLLPATRRGRYLANIVRRQAVDGTGIKFNKDADRMNAEAKKKVDVLSEELLPYIIAEQERRTTLYKRVMTAIQNGEKGVTIAEIRNKPPLIIRKGLMYRCPANRAPKEPDGSGVLMCETDIEPTPVMYDSCLSAEDKELYVADTRYFFCNRHKIEGPDLPRNGSTVIGCAPLERTSLNYTSGKCALEDTDDVVVHYRYYPDKTYKFVTELDPDHEVCDHWNPCQIGYIYSLPSPDQAMPANELWRDYEEKPEAIPEDNPEEFVPDEARANYQTSPRKIDIPEGYTFHGIGRFSLQNIRTRVTVFDKVLTNIKVKIEPPQPQVRRRQGEDETAAEGTAAESPAEDAEGTAAETQKESSDGSDKTKSQSEASAGSQSEVQEEVPAEAAASPATFINIQMFFSPVLLDDLTHYYARFESQSHPGSYKYRTIAILRRATIQTKLQEVNILPGQVMNTTKIPMKCGKCTLRSLMVRAFDGGITNLDRSKFRVRAEMDSHKYIEIDIGKTRFTDFGDYFVVIQTEDGNEERLKALSVLNIKCPRMTQSVDVGSHVDSTVKYECASCTCEDVLCEGESVLAMGRVSIVTSSKFISFNFPSFENDNACVYVGIFKDEDGKSYRRTLQVIDMVNCEKKSVTALPAEGTQFENELPYQCMGECSIEKVTLNGVPLESTTRRQAALVGVAFFTYTPTSLTIRITSFSLFYCGVYQALFNTASGPVTKTVLEIKGPDDQGEAKAEGGAGETAPPGTEASSAGEGASTAASGSDAAPSEGEPQTPSEGGESAPDAPAEATPDE